MCVQPTTVPTFSLAYNTGTNGAVPIGAAIDMRITIGTLPNVYYSPMTLDFIMPIANNTPLFTICFAEILSVGRNMPCVNQTALNSTFQYTSVQTYVSIRICVSMNNNLMNNLITSQNFHIALIFVEYTNGNS